MKLTQTAKEIVKDVAETQRKSFQAGKARIQQVSEVPTAKLYPEGVDAYRDIVKYNLKTQTKLGDKVVKHVVAAENVPTPVKDAAKRIQGLVTDLAESQADLVDRLCDVLVKAYPEDAMTSFGDALGQPMCKLREATRKMVGIEKEFLQSVLGASEKAAKKATKAAPRPTSAKKKAPSRGKKKTTARKTASKATKKATTAADQAIA